MKSCVLLLLAAGVTSGCDSATVHDNIDVFTCAWLPWWMADCSSSEVHDRAVRILDHGIVDASLECSAVTSMGLFDGNHLSIHWKKLIDGSSLLSAGGPNQRGGVPFAFFERNETVDLTTVDHPFAGECVAHHTVSDGFWTVDVVCPNDPSTDPPIHIVWVSKDISECDGFNLEAF